MRCSTCGHDNSATNTFCSKCASSLAQERATNLRAKTVYLPQLDEETHSPVAHRSRGFGWIFILLIAVAIIFWRLYG